MDYIETLLIMEDDLDEDENFGEFGQASTEQPTGSALADSETKNEGPVPSDTHNPDQIDDSASGSVPDWCVCGRCHPMTQDVENKCCKLKKGITLSSRFTKLCLDPDVIELCIRNTGDIRNDREDNSSPSRHTTSFRRRNFVEMKSRRRSTKYRRRFDVTFTTNYRRRIINVVSTSL